MHLLLHGIDNARIEHGDALRSPHLVERGRLMRFDIVVGQLPFGRDAWRRDAAESDRFNRFWRGVPPKDRGAFVRQGRDVLLLGPPGVGKSHLVQAVGRSVIRVGRTMLYRSIFDVVHDFLHEYALQGTEKPLNRYLKPDLLIIDDMGMTQLPRRGGALVPAASSRCRELAAPTGGGRASSGSVSRAVVLRYRLAIRGSRAGPPSAAGMAFGVAAPMTSGSDFFLDSYE